MKAEVRPTSGLSMDGKHDAAATEAQLALFERPCRLGQRLAEEIIPGIETTR
jgi:hypothetical protein